ncbi:MAG TPA: Nramp family divalent metal transporter [Planctomycetota bacterium]|nr:Nramp family divalent metal transporter [Planctomycetota bacterium]
MSQNGNAPVDAYFQAADAVKDPPRTLGRALMKIGPGLILAGAIVGTGELIATTNLGAKVGFGLLWLVLLSCFIKVFVQIELGRHAVSSGETTLESFKKLPWVGTFFTWWWLLMMLGTQAQMAAMVGGTGQAIHRIVPGVAAQAGSVLGEKSFFASPDVFWSIIVALVTSTALAIGSYKVVEVGTTILVVGFTGMTVACVAFLPEGSITAADLSYGLSFQIPEGAIVAAFAMFGITGVGAAELIVYPYWCIEKGYARYVGVRNEGEAWLDRARGWLRVMQLDAWVSMLVYTVATLSFYALGAATLHKHTSGTGLPGSVSAMLDLLEKMYEPMLGKRMASVFISAGALAVLYSTLFASTAANSRALADFLQVNGYVKFLQPHHRQDWIRRFVILFPLLDLLIFLFFKNPVLLVTIGAFGQALTLPMVAIGAIYLRYRRTDQRLRPGMIWDLLLFASLSGFLVSAAFGLKDAWDKVSK